MGKHDARQVRWLANMGKRYLPDQGTQRSTIPYLLEDSKGLFHACFQCREFLLQQEGGRYIHTPRTTKNLTHAVASVFKEPQSTIYLQQPPTTLNQPIRHTISPTSANSCIVAFMDVNGWPLRTRTALIVGGCRGLGASLANIYADNAWDVYATWRRLQLSFPDDYRHSIKVLTPIDLMSPSVGDDIVGRLEQRRVDHLDVLVSTTFPPPHLNSVADMEGSRSSARVSSS